MTEKQPGDVDIVEELRLRTWARENYVAAGQRDATWHPIILDEMGCRDDESAPTVKVPAPSYISDPSEVFSRLRGNGRKSESPLPRILNA